MEYFIIVVIVLVIMGLVGGILEAREEVARGEASKDAVNERLSSQEDFKPSRTLLKIGAINKKLMGLSIDDKAKRICVIKGRGLQIIPFASILAARVMVDLDDVTNTDFGDQAMRTMVGAMIGGGFGAVIGGMTSNKRTIKEVENVYLEVVLSDLAYPVHIIEFVENASAGASAINRALKEAQQWNDILKVVIHQGNMK